MWDDETEGVMVFPRHCNGDGVRHSFATITCMQCYTLLWDL